MGFWDMSKVGKDARGNLNEMPNWLKQQAQDWWGQQNEQRPISKQLQDFQMQQLMERYGQGFGSPDALRAAGGEIMPGVGEAVDRRNQRTQGLRDQAGQIPTAGDTTNRLNSITDEYGNTITGAFDDAEGVINRGYGGLLQRNERAGRDITGNISDSYGAAQKNAEALTGEARGNVGNVYGGIGRSIDDTYGGIGRNIDTAYTDVDATTGKAFGESEATLNRLNPNGDFRAARVGRSFAPAAASTALRLRRGGINPDSLEGSAALNKVENQRSRAMDDAYADENRYFVGAKNALTRDKLGLDRSSKLSRLSDKTGAAERGLGLDIGTKERGLNTDVGLTTDWRNMQAKMGLQQGADFRDELRRGYGEEAGLTQNQMGANLSNMNTAFDRGTDYYNQRRGDAMTGRNMGFQDFGMQEGLANRGNADDLTAFGLNQQQFDQGVGQRGRELGFTGDQLNQMGAMGNQAWNRGMQAGQMGGQYAGDATQGYGGTLSREAQNAGWGKKLLGGIAQAGLSLIPGVGPFLGAGLGAAMGGGGGGGLGQSIAGFGKKLLGGNNRNLSFVGGGWG